MLGDIPLPTEKKKKKLTKLWSFLPVAIMPLRSQTYWFTDFQKHFWKIIKSLVENIFGYPIHLQIFTP